MNERNAGPSEEDRAIAQVIERLNAGDSSAYQDLLPLVYDRMRSMATVRMRGERADHTLQPTALVHEVFMRLGKNHSWSLTDRAHFLAAASETMRRVLVEHARGRITQKRGGGRAAVSIGMDSLAAEDGNESEYDLERLELALRRLQGLDPRQASVVQMTMYGGMTQKEIATVLGISVRQVQIDLKMAKVTLLRFYMQDQEDED